MPTVEQLREAAIGPTPDELMRFASKVSYQRGDCWLWSAGRVGSGYGEFAYRGRQWPAHVWAWRFLAGMSVPAKGRVLMHLCHTKACVRPDHLRDGTYQENMLDTDVSHTGDIRTFKCGHQRTPENSRKYNAHNRGVACRTCDNARRRANKAKGRTCE